MLIEVLKIKKGSLSNCYVLPAPEDNLESILECAKQMARTFSYGGGVGIDLSNLRPRGATTHNAAKESSGPVSFMDLFSQVTQTISQNGRRGATMISLSINHPDIEEFIDCKTDLDRVKYANISVRVTDDFMKAVEQKLVLIIYLVGLVISVKPELIHQLGKRENFMKSTEHIIN